RKENDVFVYGIYDLILSNHKQIFGYTRTSDTKRAYVLTNLTDRVAQFTLYQGLSSSQLVLSNLLEPVAEHKDEKSFKFHPYEIRVYIIDYKNKELHHHQKKKHATDQSENIQSSLPTETKRKYDTSQSLTKKTKASLQKLEQISRSPLHQAEQSQKDILSKLAEATTRALTKSSNQQNKNKSSSISIDQEKVIPPDSSAIDLENEPIDEKRERQRSLVLNFQNIAPDVQNNPSSFDRRRRSFPTLLSHITTKPNFMGHHSDSSSDEDDDKKTTTTTTNKIEQEPTDLSGQDIDYSVLYDDTIEDFSYTSAREQAKKRILLDQQ
ncbi:unnamed protein product, partial [Rotaria sordida]